MSRLNTFPRWFLYRCLLLIEGLIIAFLIYETIGKFNYYVFELSELIFIVGSVLITVLSVLVHTEKVGYIRALTPEEVEQKEKKRKLKVTKKERNLKWKQLMETPTSEWDKQRRCSKCGRVLSNAATVCPRIGDQGYRCNKTERRQVAKHVASFMVLNTYDNTEDSRNLRIQQLEDEIEQYDRVINDFSGKYFHIWKDNRTIK